MERRPRGTSRGLIGLAAVLVIVLVYAAITHIGRSPAERTQGSPIPSGPLESMSPEAKFPVSVYPSPAFYPSWPMLEGCPSTSGLEPPSPQFIEQMLPLVASIGHVSQLVDQQSTDPAYWPVVRATWIGIHTPDAPRKLTAANVAYGPANTSPIAKLIGTTCGMVTLNHSWWVGVCPSTILGQCTMRADAAKMTNYLVIKRGGKWLVWFVATPGTASS
jgi:hypothetical protein